MRPSAGAETPQGGDGSMPGGSSTAGSEGPAAEERVEVGSCTTGPCTHHPACMAASELLTACQWRGCMFSTLGTAAPERTERLRQNDGYRQLHELHP
jgi:hypothetical protein